MMGFRDPAAKGAMVRGTRETAIILQIAKLGEYICVAETVDGGGRDSGPLERPVVAAVRGGRWRYRGGVVCCGLGVRLGE